MIIIFLHPPPPESLVKDDVDTAFDEEGPRDDYGNDHDGIAMTPMTSVDRAELNARTAEREFF
jgi:hypothetical protein